MEKFKLLGVNCILVTDISKLEKYIKDIIDNKKGGYSIAINAEKIMLASKNEKIKNIINNAILPIPDGVGALLAFRLLYGIKNCLRVDLPNLILNLANRYGYRVFILGAHEEVNKLAVKNIKMQYGNICIVGRYHGYFKDRKKIEQLIHKSKPQIVFTCLGTPKQEYLVHSLYKIFPDILFICCGGALDVLSTKVKRAPKFFQDHYLEWFYRLLTNPRRFRRQLVLPLFLIKLVRCYLKRICCKYRS